MCEDISRLFLARYETSHPSIWRLCILLFLPSKVRPSSPNHPIQVRWQCLQDWGGRSEARLRQACSDCYFDLSDSDLFLIW